MIAPKWPGGGLEVVAARSRVFRSLARRRDERVSARFVRAAESVVGRERRHFGARIVRVFAARPGGRVAGAGAPIVLRESVQIRRRRRRLVVDFYSTRKGGRRRRVRQFLGSRRGCFMRRRGWLCRDGFTRTLARVSRSRRRQTAFLAGRRRRDLCGEKRSRERRASISRRHCDEFLIDCKVRL